MKKCNVKRHFECDGTGLMCDVCGESEAAGCSHAAMRECATCCGTGKLCVVHELPPDQCAKEEDK